MRPSSLGPSEGDQHDDDQPEEEADLLAQAAELYGVAPSTLARMLVRRGAQAIIARDR